MIKNVRIIAVLNLPYKVLDLIAYAKSIHGCTLKSIYFTGMIDLINNLEKDFVFLDTMNTGLSASPPTNTMLDRDMAAEVVKKDLRDIRNSVQIIADNNPSMAEVIIKSAGLGVKQSSSYTIAKNIARDGEELGSVDLVGVGKGAHQWFQSLDAGNTSIQLDPTSTSSNTVYGLVPGQTVWFRNRQLLKGNRYTDWGAWVEITLRSK